MNFKISHGVAAANIYAYDSTNNFIGQLQLDWTYKSIDFKYKNTNWKTFNYNSSLNNLENNEKEVFIELAKHAISNLENTSIDAINYLKSVCK